MSPRPFPGSPQRRWHVSTRPRAALGLALVALVAGVVAVHGAVANPLLRTVSIQGQPIAVVVDEGTGVPS